jgi:hypothetical protein
MSSPNETTVAEAIRSELAATHASFHALLVSFSEDEWQRPSLNSGWTNGEILAHILFGFIVVNVLLPMTRLWGRLPKSSSKPFAWLLDVSTRPFNWVNALGARMQGQVFTSQRIGKVYDRVYASLLTQVASITGDEWERGMYYPTRWDPNFSDFMTVEELLLYPIRHYHFHRTQLSRGG